MTVPEEGYTIGELLDVFRQLNAHQWRGILIGGQAVNLYANHYAEQFSAFDSFHPLASRDLDFQGGPRDAMRAMKILNSSGRINDGKDSSPNAGVLQVMLPSGDMLIVDILTSVFGVSTTELFRSAVRWTVKNASDDLSILVIHPLLLMESKLACFRTLDQTHRQDEKHVRLLGLVLRAWLREQLSSPRLVFRSIERIVVLMQTPDGLFASDRQINLWDLVPLEDMSNDPIYAEFFQKRLPQLISDVEHRASGGV